MRLRLLALAVSVMIVTPARAQDRLALTLGDAERVALENNGTFVVTREDVAISAAVLRGARAAFIPRLVSELRYFYDNNPGNYFFTAFLDQQVNGVAAVEGRLPTGMDYRLSVDFLRDDNDGSSSVYTPANRVTARLTLTQPLLRNAWLRVNRGAIEVASLRRDANVALRQAEIERVVAEVELAYWGLVLALKEREVRTSALNLAREQVNDSRTQLQHGAVAQIDVVEAESAVARRIDEIESANQDITEAEGRLRTLLQPRPDQRAGSSIDYQPSDLPDLLPLAASLDEQLQIARRRRPDLEAARLNLQAEKVAETVARNKLWPVLDLFGSVGLTGFSGQLSTGYGTAGFAGPYGGNTPIVHDITGQTLPPFRPDPSLEGGVDTMFKNMRFFSGTVGVRLEVPFDNSLAASALDAQRAQVRKQQATLQALERQIEAQVTTAWKRLAVDRERIRATAEVERLAQQFLEGQRKRFRNGVSVSFDVLRAAEEVARARIAHARAQVSARISQARLALATGQYLDQHQIKVR